MLITIKSWLGSHWSRACLLLCINFIQSLKVFLKPLIYWENPHWIAINSLRIVVSESLNIGEIKKIYWMLLSVLFYFREISKSWRNWRNHCKFGKKKTKIFIVSQIII